MKHMQLFLNRKFQKETVTVVDVYRGMFTEVTLRCVGGKNIELTLGEAPEWLRQMVRVNEHNLKEMGAK